MSPHALNQVDSNTISYESTTAFVDDATVAISAFPLIKQPPPMSLTTMTDSSIASFFSKPYLFNTISWSSGTAVGSDISVINIKDHLIANTYYTNKLQGYRWFRGTANIKVIINAQPFQQGRLLLHYLPFVAERGPDYVAAHNYSLRTMSTQPNVELDCRQSSAVLQIPYVHPIPWVDVRNNQTAASTVSGSWGNVYLTILAPLQSAAATDCWMSIYVYFTDVQLAGPYHPQADLAEEASVSTSVTKQASKASKYLRFVSRGVPSLTSMVTQPSWVALAKGACAAAFGFAKPPNDKPALYTVLRPHRNMCHSNGETTSESLSLNSANSVKVLPGFAGTDVDEMSWDYIKAIPMYTTYAEWDTSQATDTSLWGQTLGGSYGVAENVTRLITSCQVYTTPPFSAIANQFKYCRGGLRLHIKAVKTDFHCGRISVIWSPGGNYAMSFTTPDVTNAMFTIREIIDIRDSSEWIITLPYQVSTPWVKTIDALGKVFVRVVTPLRTTSVASSSIRLLFYLSAAPDFELAMPSASGLIPWVPQADFDISPAGVNSEVDSKADEYCMGESFNSVKQLISRYSRWFTGAGQTDFKDQTCFTFYPFFVSSVSSDASTGALNTGALLGDMYSYVASGYGLARGGMNFIIAQSSSTSVSIQYDDSYNARRMSGGSVNSPYYTAYGNATSSANTLNNGVKSDNTIFLDAVTSGGPTNMSTNLAVFVQSTNGVEFTVPSYCATAYRINPHASRDTDVWDLVHLVPYPLGQVQYSTQTALTYKRLYRAAADDAQLGLFIGFPPFFLGTI